MLDKSKVGHQFPEFTVDIEKGRLKFFAKAIGETNPVYIDEASAKSAGYRTLPAPPTFPMVLDGEAPEFFPIQSVLDMDISRVLHGEQTFCYLGTIYVGDAITVASQITDIYDKKQGALEFVILENTYTNQIGSLVASSTQTLIYQND